MEKTLYTVKDLTVGTLPGHPTPMLGIEYAHEPDGECPDSEDWYAERIQLPQGFRFGEGLITDGVEFISVEHLCGEPCYIE